MSQVPVPTPIFPNGESVYVSIRYDRRFTTVEDVTHDDNHIHDFFEIYVNLAGDVSFLVDNTIYKVHRGDVIITKPNELHRCIYHSDCIHEHFCIWSIDTPPMSDMLMECLGRDSIVVLPETEKEQLIEYCFGLYEADQQAECSRIHLASNYFNILQLICNNRQSAPEEQNLPQNFVTVIDYITQHYSEPSFNVKCICDEFFISQSTLLRRFRQYFQTSPSTYIESKRLSKSKQLLSKGYSVQSACFFSGFSDCSYYILRFRKKFGMTPYKYQKIGMEIPRTEPLRTDGFVLPRPGRKLDPKLAAELKAELEMNPKLAAELRAELGMGISFDLDPELEAILKAEPEDVPAAKETDPTE